MKTCYRCGVAKPLLEFQDRKGAKDGKRNDCRACSVERVRRNYEKHHEREKARQRDPERLAKNVVSKRKALTGFCAALFEATQAAQGWRCAICARDLRALPTKHVHADHCHATKKPRGVLCHSCNCALGLLGDDPARLRKAIDYLSRPPAVQLQDLA